ncbi:MAG: hypothetical protein PVI90_09315 [Desulfobacteraceae bacterium]
MSSYVALKGSSKSIHSEALVSRHRSRIAPSGGATKTAPGRHTAWGNNSGGLMSEFRGQKLLF